VWGEEGYGVGWVCRTIAWTAWTFSVIPCTRSRVTDLFLTTKPLTRNNISCLEDASKLAYSNVEFQKLQVEDPRPLFKEEEKSYGRHMPI
jgi:hypothetical protein